MLYSWLDGSWFPVLFPVLVLVTMVIHSLFEFIVCNALLLFLVSFHWSTFVYIALSLKCPLSDLVHIYWFVCLLYSESVILISCSVKSTVIRSSLYFIFSATFYKTPSERVKTWHKSMLFSAGQVKYHKAGTVIF